MKLTIGGREVIESAFLQVPDGEDAQVEFLANKWNLRLVVKFVTNQDTSVSGFDLEAKTDHAVLTLKNWNHTLPGSIMRPFALGETDGRKISMLFSGYAVQGFKFLALSFFWEKADG